MGEVYRARDARLDRDVGLKILPADVVVDAPRLEYARRALARWYWEEDFIELRIDGLRKALALVGAEPKSSAATSALDGPSDGGTGDDA